MAENIYSKKINILHTGDLHLSGKNFDKCKEGLSQILSIVKSRKIDLMVVSGDTFNRANISDRYASAGKIIKLLLNFVYEVTETTDMIFIKGNHDYVGTQESALEVLKGIDRVYVIDHEPKIIWHAKDKEVVAVGCLPYMDKSNFYSTHCKGKSSTESDSLFRENVSSMLAKLRNDLNQFKHVEHTRMIFFHGNIQGTKINDGYMVDGSGFSFTKRELQETGAKYISGSHIHKRGDCYVGSPWQNDFGDEGNPQVIEIISIEDGKIEEECVELDMPQFRTIDVYDYNKDLYGLCLFDTWEYKFRFYSEEAFNIFTHAEESLSSLNLKIEKLWAKHKAVRRTETELTPEKSDKELLEEWIKINDIPDGIDKSELMEDV